MVAVRAFIDDSCDTTNHRVLVLAGYVADLETWARFTEEWNEMLRLTGLSSFKMSAVGTSPDSLVRAGAFYRIIENHLNLPIAVAIDLNGLKAALEKYGMQHLSNAYEHAYRAMIDQVALNHDAFGADGPIEFIFDKHGAERSVTEGFEEFKSFHPAVVNKQYPRPRFEDDRYFVPLQAADLLAWHVRQHWLREGTLITGLPVMSWQKQQPVRYMAFDLSAEKLDETFREEAVKRTAERAYRDVEATITFSIDLCWPPKSEGG